MRHAMQAPHLVQSDILPVKGHYSPLVLIVSLAISVRSQSSCSSWPSFFSPACDSRGCNETVCSFSHFCIGRSWSRQVWQSRFLFSQLRKRAETLWRWRYSSVCACECAKFEMHCSHGFPFWIPKHLEWLFKSFEYDFMIVRSEDMERFDCPIGMYKLKG